MKRNILLAIFFVVTAFVAIQTIRSVSHAQEKPVSAKEAMNHVGEVQTVCGVVASTKYSNRSRRQPTFLNLDQPYPTHIFTVLIWGADRAKFPQAPEVFYQGKKICVKGKIELYKGKPEIIVNDLSQITIAPSQ